MEFMKLDGAVDLHVHSYPCVFQRRVDDRQAAQAAQDAGMAAIVLKCHHESTVSRAYLIQQEFPDLKVFGGVVLNQFVGGINPGAAEVGLRLGAKEIWMPTIDAPIMLRCTAPAAVTIPRPAVPILSGANP